MRTRQRDEQHEDFWPAFTDILMVTCLILILLAAVFALFRQDDRIQQEIDRRKQLFQSRFNDTFRLERENGRIRLDSPRGEQQTISFSDQVLFGQGSASLEKQAGRDSLAKLAQLIARGCKDNDLFERVIVNGHTDPVPIETTEFPSNWHLSSARATAVVYFLVKAGVTPTRLMAAGFGEFRPYTPAGEWIASHDRQRRIEVVLTYSPPWIAKQLLAARGNDSVR